MTKALKKLFRFTFLQAISCIFPAVIFASLLLTKGIDIPLIHRYDLLLLICLTAQFLMIYTKLETLDELKVICLFHLIGLGLELFKVHMGSWSYPEPAWTKIGGVPLYSGFLYASVASYVCQAWRNFDLKIHHWPKRLITYPLAVLIYANFFTHHYLPDFRWALIASLFLFFKSTHVKFKIYEKVYRMHMILAFFLIGFFIWIAENISTFLGAWQYPHQKTGWKLVDLGKFSSWFLLIIITLIIVVNLKHLKTEKNSFLKK